MDLTIPYTLPIPKVWSRKLVFNLYSVSHINDVGASEQGNEREINFVCFIFFYNA